MLFTSQGRSVLGKTVRRYPRPRAQFFPIRTSRLVNNIYVFIISALYSSHFCVTVKENLIDDQEPL